MPTTKHTPGPQWKAVRAFRNNSPDQWLVTDCAWKGYTIAVCDTEADAQKITQALNSAPALVEALRELLAIAGEYIAFDEVVNADISDAVNAARAALASVEREPLKLSGTMVPGYAVQLAGTPEPTDA